MSTDRGELYVAVGPGWDQRGEEDAQLGEQGYIDLVLPRGRILAAFSASSGKSVGD